ncbi:MULTISPECIES: hypothetical protein [Desulfitobacterium]|uniref:Dehalogenase n=1 Tax=Desulfitobacterium dehalogenans (strain ATCC 51507 / DSM 9161 / JW/IU-DC1) TaxID=756499 RepID=I4A5L4_DESDJ|nr:MULTISPECIES: hypothetical protein [Desulfitobacterium]AFL99248.1 hypothetical protein Desde_0802 [Desulfitobacterium dehalogenans ATCC 51507]
MYTLWIFLLGVIATIGIQWLKPQIHKWYMWLAFAVWFFWTLLGISFVRVNLSGNHVQAATVGAFLFFIISIAAGIYLARISGLKPASKITAKINN